MNENMLIKELVNYNFTEYEAKAFLVLIKKSSLSATEVSQMGGIPRTKVYEVLNNLTGKGFCSEIPGSIRRFKAISPDISFKKVYYELENRKKELQYIEDTLTPIFHDSRTDSDPLDYIEIIRKKEISVDKINNLINSAKKEIIIMNKIPFYNSLEDYYVDGEIKMKINKNLQYKYIFQMQKDITPSDDSIPVLQYLYNQKNVKVKFSYDLPIKFFCVDSKVVFISLKDKVKANDTMTAMMIEHIDMVKSFKDLFKMYWKISFDFNTFPYLRSTPIISPD